MSTKPLNVLSIDFDYFVDAAQFEKHDFPDPNEDLPAYVNTYLWMTHYATSLLRKEHEKSGGRLLSEIDIDWKAFTQVKNFLKAFKKCEQSKHTKVVITNSHAEMFDEIELMQPGGPVRVLNLDDHHDFYDIGEDLNCGNWGNKLMSFLKKQGNSVLADSEVVWIPQSDSSIEVEECKAFEELLSLSPQYTDVSKLGEMIQKFFQGDIDLIFLCRSGCWVPPHLDFRFLDLKDMLVKLNGHYKLDEQVAIPRYTSKFKKQVNQHYNVLKGMNFTVPSRQYMGERM